ncbi:MAG: phosphopantetheine-binding protein [Planctomycetota bacterium]|nr:phosphopantetheine-binding protein [Planctomycetota bacterium]MDA1142220.1 phosphopantetheine-binding protein [Planctomycetota bacterium]
MSVTPELEDQLKKMIVELLFLKIQPDEIGTDDDLMETIDLDSVRIFDIVVGLETEMDIEIDEDEFDIENFRTVRQIAEFITKKQAGA